MAALQRVASSASTSASGYASSRGGGGDVVVPGQFPVGLQVLVVDDDTTCLRILEKMLRRLHYHVTTCSQATMALNLLRERRGCFDVVLSDVHMPDMDGYKLLEHVGLEMDLPVIMMSADGRTSAVMKGIRHGACDYLIKPIRDEELKNIWQHVVRKKWNENRENEHSGSLEENDRQKRGNDDAEYASSVNEVTGFSKGPKKRSNVKDEDSGELENDDPSASKKPRVVWSVELHQQFVSAVNQLGIDKAVPKRILELMNVPGLTRENVASHLQKFRLYLKRLSGVAQQSGITSTFCGPLDSNVKFNPLGRLDIQALIASGQIPPQTLAALHAELLGQPMSGIVGAVDQPALLQASMQKSKCIPVEHGMTFGQSLVKCQSNISKNSHQNIIPVAEVGYGSGVWPSNVITTVGASNSGGQTMLMDVLQQRQQQNQLQRTRQQSLLLEPIRSINVQPSCLVVPTQSLANFQAENIPTLVNQNFSLNRNPIVDYSLISSQSNNSSANAGHISDGYFRTTGVLAGYPTPASISPSVSSCSINAENNTAKQVSNSIMTIGVGRQGLPPHICSATPICDIQGSYGEATKVLDQGPIGNLRIAVKGNRIPSRLAVDEFESSVNNLSVEKICMESIVDKVKLEPNVEFIDTTRVGIPMLPQFPPSDIMSVFTE